MWCIFVLGSDGIARLLGYGSEERCRLDARTIRKAGGEVAYVGPAMLSPVWGDQWRN